MSNQCYEKKEQFYENFLKNIRFQFSYPAKIEQVNKKEDEFFFQLQAVLKQLVNKDRERSSQQFLAFQENLRALLLGKEYKLLLTSKDLKSPDEEGVAIVHSLCRIIFLGISLRDFSSLLVKEVQGTHPKEKREFSFEKLSERLLNSHDALYPKVISLKPPFFAYWKRYFFDQMNWGFDAFVQGNLPYRLFSIYLDHPRKGKQRITNIRMGTPTQEDFFSIFLGGAKINPEFYGFLDGYRVKKERHLFINLQDSRAKFVWKNEATRCRALENLGKEYSDVITVVGLSKDSDFYWQKGRCGGSSSYGGFKEKFISQLFCDLDGGYFFPEELSNIVHINLFSEMEEIIDGVHKNYFSSLAELTVEEKKDFIEIVHGIIIEWLLIKTKAKSINISCKDGIDRAAAANGFFLFYLLMKSHMEIKNIDYHDIEAILLAPALLVRQRPIKRERLERMLSAASYLYRVRSNKGRTKEVLFDEWSVEKISFW